MSAPCDRIEELLAAEEALGEQDRAHVAGCPRCTATAAALARVDAGLRTLAARDAADPLVARTLAAVRAAAVTKPPWLRRPRRVGMAAAASFLVMVVSGWVVLTLPRRDLIQGVAVSDGPRPELPDARRRPAAAATPPPPPPPPPASAPAEAEGQLAAVGQVESGVEGGIAGGLPAAEPLLLDELREDKKSLARDGEDDRAEKNEALGKDHDALPVSESYFRDADLRQGKTDSGLAGAKEKSADLPAGSRRANAADAADAAQLFLAEREQIEGLRFQPAQGYWRNTYVPGDPHTRLLAARLGQGGGPRLDRGARSYDKPYDAPAGTALALYLHADRPAIEGPSRLLVEVGLKGAEVHAGPRGERRVAVVLDLRQAPAARDAAAIRALLDALAELKQPGDRFSLTIAGRPQSVAPADFRRGPLSVALGDALSGPPAKGGVPSLPEALERAVREAGQADAGDAPPGAASVLLVTAHPLTAELDRLTAMAHAASVNGVPLGVVAVGADVPPAEPRRLALAGQGGVHALAAPAGAKALAERELDAASRTVARALRLKVKLAPGVKLVGIFDSRRLSNADSRRVKQAEQSIDRKLAKALGIEADRGEDEDGIQIVIPAYHAGDEHAFLLDVVAERPGPIAEATLRFKDLVGLRNSTARASLAVPAGNVARGPLERGVLKERLAHRLAEDLRGAAEIAGSDPQAARARLEAAARLVEGLARLVPGWEADAELAADVRLLSAFASALASPDPRLADSLRLAATRKLLTPLDLP